MSFEDEAAHACITQAGWKSMEKRLPVALRALARFKSAKKGRRDAEDAADAEACVVGSVITLPLVVALVLLLLSQRQLPSASVFDHEKAETRGLCMWWQ